MRVETVLEKSFSHTKKKVSGMFWQLSGFEFDQIDCVRVGLGNGPVARNSHGAVLFEGKGDDGNDKMFVWGGDFFFVLIFFLIFGTS